eukprot:6381238-Prymnesium_polylepis.2
MEQRLAAVATGLEQLPISDLMAALATLAAAQDAVDIAKKLFRPSSPRRLSQDQELRCEAQGAFARIFGRWLECRRRQAGAPPAELILASRS